MAGINLQGQRFGRLTVIEENGRRSNQILWKCLCDCGKECSTIGQLLREEKTRSCGCLLIERRKEIRKTHGQADSPLYRVYRAMRNRCENPNVKSYQHYGARGIKVCERWHTFENFYADMGNRPEDGTLERIDNNGNYEPSNVRWATKKEQANNKRNNRIYVSSDGTEKNMSQWAKELGISPSGLQARIRRGMIQDDAVNKPAPKNLKKPNAKYTDDDIRTIRKLCLTTSNIKIAKMYGVSATSIYHIKIKQTYQDIL